MNISARINADVDTQRESSVDEKGTVIVEHFGGDSSGWTYRATLRARHRGTPSTLAACRVETSDSRDNGRHKAKTFMTLRDFGTITLESFNIGRFGWDMEKRLQ